MGKPDNSNCLCPQTLGNEGIFIGSSIVNIPTVDGDLGTELLTVDRFKNAQSHNSLAAAPIQIQR